MVITGMGALSPIGTSVDEFWDSLLERRVGIRTSKHPAVADHSVRIAGEVDLPDVPSFMPRKLARRLGRFIVMAQGAAVEAFEDSGLDPADIEANSTRYGAIFGNGSPGSDVHCKNIERIRSAGTLDAASPYYVVGVVPNTPPALFAQRYGLRGPNFSVSSACASSNHALAVAAMHVRSGMADVVFAGGAECVVDLPAFAGFAVIGALSQRNDDPESASRPFDRDRDGFVLAEGAGVLCLEELEHARRRGARIYAELTGIGTSCDAHDMVSPHPDGDGAVLSMQAALDDAGVLPTDVGLVNAHGTSTPLGDVAEARAIRRVFKNGAGNVPVHSTKSYVGHMIGAAGAIEAIAGILAIDRGVIHPSLNVFEQDPAIDVNVVTGDPMEVRVDHVLSNGFGFGGQNGSLVLSRFQ